MDTPSHESTVAALALAAAFFDAQARETLRWAGAERPDEPLNAALLLDAAKDARRAEQIRRVAFDAFGRKRGR
jgi:hypothetical protein